MTTYYLDMDKISYNGIICYSITKYENDKITAMDEYYADDGIAPQWRLDKHIGTAIK